MGNLENCEPADTRMQSDKEDQMVKSNAQARLSILLLAVISSVMTAAPVEAQNATFRSFNGVNYGMPPDLVHLSAGCPFRPRCRFAVERCKEENPPLVSVAQDHYSACWEWERVAKVATGAEAA